MKNNILIKIDGRSQISEFREIIERMANEALSERGYPENVELSIVFVSKKVAKAANINYRQKDYIPQVLGFPMSKERDEDGYVRLGDIMICTQKLKYEAVFQGTNIREILKEWLRHGVDNLLK